MTLQMGNQGVNDALTAGLKSCIIARFVPTRTFESQKLGQKAFQTDLSRFDLWEFCRTGGQLDSAAHSLKFERLESDATVEAVHEVQWKMNGVINSRRESTVQIRGTMRIDLVCMTCGGPLSLEIPLSRDLVLMPTEQAAEQYDEDNLGELDDVVACGDYVEIQQWLEDELLLSLPMVPRHLEGCAHPEASFARDEDYESAEKSAEFLETRKPFANLDQLIKKTKH